MKVEPGPDGRIMLQGAKQKWGAGEGGNPQIMQTATFAGHVMMAIRDELDLPVSLNFLGFESDGFDSMEKAIEAGPEFARSVLDHMKSLIDG